MNPGLYALIEPIPFAVPVNPGATPVYQNFPPPAVMKIVGLRIRTEQELFFVLHEHQPHMLPHAG